MTKRLDAKLAAELSAKLAPLMALREASDLSGLARGLAYRLSENLGVLRRDSASEEIKALDQAARGQMRKYGVRFGAFNVYIPTLLKPAAADLLLCSGRCIPDASTASMPTRFPPARSKASPRSKPARAFPRTIGASPASTSLERAPCASTCWSACRI